jgi:hypothetical protein
MYALCYKLEVAGSIPDEVFGFFSNVPNPSDRTMALDLLSLEQK